MDRAVKSKIQQLSGENHLQAHRANFLHDVLVPPKLLDGQAAPIAFIDPSAPAVHQPSMTLASRFARAPAGNKLAEFVSQMEMVARVANGATLVNGFVNGTITGNIVIAELLHMGSLTPDELIGMTDSDVSQLFEPLSTLSADLVENSELVAVENNYIAMNDALSSNLDIDAVTNLVNKTTYETQLGFLSNTTINVNSAKNAVNGLISQLGEVPGLQAKLQTDPNYVIRKFGSIDSIAQDVESALANFAPVLTLVNELKSLVELSSFLQLLTDEYEARQRFNTGSIGQTAKTRVISNFEMFNNQSAKLDSHKLKIANFHDFLNSRTSLSPPTFKHTAGFPKGRESLDPLDMDTMRPSLTSRVNGTKQSSGHLQRGLRPLDGFNSKLKAVEKAWDLANPKVNSAKKIFKLVDDMVEENSKAQTRIDKANDFKTCYEGFDLLDITDISSAKQLIEKLNAEIKSIGNFENVEDLKNLEPLKTIVTYANDTDVNQKKAATPEMLNKLNKYDVAGLIKKLDSVLANISTLNTIVTNGTNIVSEIKTGLTVIDGYHQNVKNNKFGSLMRCLAPIGADGVLVADMIESIRVIRAMKGTQDVADAQGYLTTIKSSSTVLQTALDSVRDFKNLTTPEVKSLSEFKKESVSQDLGMAVQGMLVIEKLESNRQQLDALTGDVQYIVNATAKYANIGNFSVHYTLLNTIDSLKTNLTAVLTEVGKVKTAVESLKGTDLKSYGPVFTAAKDLQSMQTDFKKWMAAVEALKQLDPSLPDMTNVLASLDTLDELDLDFVKYKFASAPAALGELQQYFTNWNNIVAIIPAATSGGNVGQSPQDVQIVYEEESNIYWNVGIGVGIAAGIVLLFALITICVKKILAIRKEKELMKKVFSVADDMLMALEGCAQTGMTPFGLLNKQMEVFEKLNEQVHQNNVTHARKSRYPDIFRNEKNAVQLKPISSEMGEDPVFIHANVMSCNDSSWILAQAPLDGTERHGDGLKENTCETHWQMIAEKEVTLIVQLCNFVEGPLGKVKCSKYYPMDNEPAQTHGEYTVKFLEKQSLSKETFTQLNDKYSLVKVEYQFRKKTKTVEILRFFGWPDHGTPKETRPCYEMVRFAEKHKSVLVHCSAGVGRTGTLAGVMKGMELSETGHSPGVNTICVALRDFRRHAMQGEAQLLYMLLAMTKGLILKYNNPRFVKSYAALRWNYDKLIKGHWEHEETLKLDPNEKPVTFKKPSKYHNDAARYTANKDEYGRMNTAAWRDDERKDAKGNFVEKTKTEEEHVVLDKEGAEKLIAEQDKHLAKMEKKWNKAQCEKGGKRGKKATKKGDEKKDKTEKEDKKEKKKKTKKSGSKTDSTNKSTAEKSEGGETGATDTEAA